MEHSGMNYEESVRWLRKSPEHEDVLRISYLDEDNLIAADRFRESEEFAAVRKILRLDSVQKGLKILDVGCGNGIASYSFASLGHDVTCIDPDPSAEVGLGATIRLKRSLERGSISALRALAEQLPFAAGSFDIVYTRQAVHHFYDLEAGLRECSRVLRSGGYLLATREHVVSGPEELKEFLDGHILHKLHGGENAYPVSCYHAALRAAGLDLVRTFAPFDTVLNHFPVNNAEVRQWFVGGLKRRFGTNLGSALARVALAERVYRLLLSKRCTFPGRMYSFLCSK